MNCKPGDMAVMVNCVFPDNNGVFVDVLEVVPTGTLWVVDGRTFVVPEPSWLVRVKAGVIDNRQVRIDAGETAAVPDCILRPIRPPAQSTDTTQAKELEVTA